MKPYSLPIILFSQTCYTKQNPSRILRVKGGDYMLTNKAKIIIGVTSLLVLGGLISNQVIFEKRIQRLEEKNVTVVETVVTPSSTPSAALTATPSVTKAPTFIQRSVTATPTN